MKSPRLLLLSLAWPLLAAAGGCAEKNAPSPKAPDAPAVPAPKPVVAVSVPGLPLAAIGAPPASSRPPELVPGLPLTWDTIKNLPYERRAEFVEGLARLGRELDDRIAELEKKGAAMTTVSAEWNLAMRALRDARVYLGAVAKELPSATAEFWAANRDKAGRAFQDVQNAIDRVRRSTTS